MRDLSLFIATIGAILVSICSSNSLGLEETTKDEPLKMASESLVVKSYKNTETTTSSTANIEERFHRYQIYQGVMGRPGIDFPAFSAIPATGFSCRNVKKSGYYADLDTDCQVFHICDRNRKISFLCPNGTIFRQSHLICDWWFRVDCGKSVELYDESAEQLEADQRFYKARAEERQRRRKLVRTSTQSSVSGEEGSSSESINSEESFNQGKSQTEHHRSNYFTTSTKQPPLRFDARKSQRNSKKVGTFGRTGSGRNHYDRQTESASQLNQGVKDSRQFTVEPPSNKEQKQQISFINNQQSSGNQEFETEGSRESIYEAESGSLVEDLSNRNKNYGFNAGAEDSNTEINNKQRHNNFEQSGKKRVLKKLIINGVGKSTQAPRNEKSTEQSIESGDEAQTTSSGVGITGNLDLNFNSRETTTTFYENQKQKETFTTSHQENTHRNTDFNINRQNINSTFGNFHTKIQGSEVTNSFDDVRPTLQNLKENYKNDKSEYFQSSYTSDQKYDFSSSSSIDNNENNESYDSNGNIGKFGHITSIENSGSTSSIFSTERSNGNIGSTNGFYSSKIRGNIVNFGSSENSDSHKSFESTGSTSSIGNSGISEIKGSIATFSTDNIGGGKNIDNNKSFSSFGTSAKNENIVGIGVTDSTRSRGNIPTSSSNDNFDNIKSFYSDGSTASIGNTNSFDATDSTLRSGNTGEIFNTDTIKNFNSFGTTASSGNVGSVGSTVSIGNKINTATFNGISSTGSIKNFNNFGTTASTGNGDSIGNTVSIGSNINIATFNGISSTDSIKNFNNFGNTESTKSSGNIGSFSNFASTSLSKSLGSVDSNESSGRRGSIATFGNIDSIGTTVSGENIASIGATDGIGNSGSAATFSGSGNSESIRNFNSFDTTAPVANIDAIGITANTGNGENIATLSSFGNIGATISSGNVGATISSGNIGATINSGNTGATISNGNIGTVKTADSSKSSDIVASISSFGFTGKSEDLGNIHATDGSGSSSPGIISSSGSSGKQINYNANIRVSEDSYNENINFSYGTTAVPSNTLKEFDREVNTDGEFRYTTNKNFEYITTQRPLHQDLNNFEGKSTTFGSSNYNFASQSNKLSSSSNNKFSTISDESVFQNPTPSTVVKNFDADYVSSFEVVHPSSQTKDKWAQGDVNIVKSPPKSFQNTKQTYISLNHNLGSDITSKVVQQPILNSATTEYPFTPTETNFDFHNEGKTTTEKYIVEYTNNSNLDQTEINSQVTSTAFGGDERKKEETQTSDIDTTQYTTKVFNYETTTNPIIRQQTESSTAATRQNQFFDNTTPSNIEDEKQLLVETAAFGSNRNGKSYFGYQSQWNVLANHNALKTTTENAYKTPYSEPTESTFTTDSEIIAEEQFSTTTEFYKTTPRPSSKINSKRVTFAAPTVTETFRTEARPTTTFKPYFETTTENVYNTENIYFTTSIPKKNPPLTDNFRIEGTSPRSESETTQFGIDLKLHELNINKEISEENGRIKSNLNENTEDLEVPPSAGPNAIGSFALFYDTRNRTAEQQTTDYLFATNAPESSSAINSFKLRVKEVVQQVDNLVQKSSLNVSEHPLADEKLPNSLTVQTQDSYLTLFAGTEKTEPETETKSSTEKTNSGHPEFDFGSTTFGDFTEEPTVINEELGKNDLHGSQSRGLVEPEVHENPDGTKVAPDLRTLAQVFTKALSAYLDDPEGFRKVLSEVRPTEPNLDTESGAYNGNEYPSATQEDYEVLDFSDVTKPSHKKKQLTSTTAKEITTESVTEVFKTNVNDSENLIVPANNQSWATSIELTAPLLESLDESQSSYYTPPTFTGTTNPVAEAINGFIAYTRPIGESNEEPDSYFPETTTQASTLKYGGFLNNSKETTKYSPYGSELSFEAFPPIRSNTLAANLPNTADTAATVVTENPFTTPSEENSTSFYSHYSQNRTEEEEIQLAKELNNLVLLQKFTTPRGSNLDSSAVTQNLLPSHLSTINDVSQNLDVKVENEHVVEINHSSRTGKYAHFSEENFKSEYTEGVNKEINPVQESSSTPKGFLITYSLPNTDAATFVPKTTIPPIISTTYGPEKTTTFNFAPETTTTPTTQKDSIFYETTTFEYRTTPSDSTTQTFAAATEPLERIAELQESLMFPDNSTVHPKDEARETVEEIMDNLNVTPSTSHTLMKMMEMAAKNETYRRLVLLLVNDKSGKNKTAEEARLSLLRALLTPVINSQTTRSLVPIPDASKLSLTSLRSGREIESENTKKTKIEIDLESESESSGGSGTVRRSKSIGSEYFQNPTTATISTEPPAKGVKNKTLRRMKIRKILTRGNGSRVELAKRTIDNSKNKQIKANSLEQDAIVDSDSRAVELLRSLYSLAARWG